jgi:hypothetical protein
VINGGELKKYLLEDIIGIFDDEGLGLGSVDPVQLRLQLLHGAAQ